MKNSDDLHELIHSLSMSEKRYFKIFASRHVKGKENNYMRLFNVIDKQKEYDEEQIKQAFKGEVFIRQLFVTKNYLHQLILESLRIFYSKDSVKIRLRNMLTDIEILFQKGLYSQCMKAVERTKELAYRYEQYFVVLECIIHTQIKLTYIIEKDVNKLNELVSGLLKEIQNIMNMTNNEFQYRDSTNRFYLMYSKHGMVKNIEYINELKKVLNHPLFSDEEKALTYQAKEMFHSTRGIIYNILIDQKKSYECFKNYILLSKQNPIQIDFSPKKYISNINNFIIACISLGKMQEALKEINALKNFPAKSPNLKIQLFETVYCNELSIYIPLGDLEKGLALIPEIEKGLELFKSKLSLPRILAIEFNVVCLYFRLEQYKKALHWLNKILNIKGSIRSDMLTYSRIINLIIHFEMGNWELLENAVRSVYRCISGRKILFRYEQIILKFIKNKQKKINTRGEMKEAFKELRGELMEIANDPSEKESLEVFDIISWLESKIENRPFVEIIKEKIKKQGLS